MSKNAFWNERFNKEEYIFGKDPSQFLVENQDFIPKHGTVFVPADGEGRNSCFIAKLGADVVASDYSNVAIEKAKKLAEEQKVYVEFVLSDIEEADFPEAKYDAVVAIFIQFLNPEVRAKVFEKLKASLKPNGIFMLHGYTPKQLEYKTGGPSAIENLYTKELMNEMFAGFEILKMEECEKELDEGLGHKGFSAIIDVIAKKPE